MATDDRFAPVRLESDRIYLEGHTRMLGWSTGSGRERLFFAACECGWDSSPGQGSQTHADWTFEGHLREAGYTAAIVIEQEACELPDGPTAEEDWRLFEPDNPAEERESLNGGGAYNEFPEGY